MPVLIGLLGLIAAYLTSRTSRVMIVILYMVREQIASTGCVSYQCVVVVVN